MEFDEHERTAGSTGPINRVVAIVAIGLAATLLSGCGWVISFETASNAFAERIGFDPFGNVRLSGVVQETIDADPGAGEVILTGPSVSFDFANFDIVLDGDGEYVASNLTGPPRATQVASTVDGSYYRYGSLTGTVDIDPGPGVTELTAGSGLGDLFIAKFDAFGTVLWANIFAADGLNVVGGDFAVDGNGDLFVVGDLDGTVDVDPGPGVRLLTSAGRSDGWAAKYNPQGQLIWATSMGGADLDRARDFAINLNGDLVVVGRFTGTANFGPGPGGASFTSAGESDGFVVTLAGTSGDVLRAGVFNSPSSFTLSDDAVSTGPDGSITVVGTLGAGVDVPADLDPGPGVASRVGGFFAVRLDPDGSLRWASAMGQAEGLTEVSSHTVDTDGSVILGGTFVGSADFDPGPGEVVIVADGLSEMFLMRLTNDGELDWVSTFGSVGNDSGAGVSDVAVDGGGFVYVTGRYTGQVDFDPGPAERILTATSGDDLFLLKLDGGGNLMVPAVQALVAGN